MGDVSYLVSSSESSGCAFLAVPRYLSLSKLPGRRPRLTEEVTQLGLERAVSAAAKQKGEISAKVNYRISRTALSRGFITDRAL